MTSQVNKMRKIPTIIRNLGTLNTKTNVGFSLIPDQIRENSIKRGFELNILVVGRRGSGTSTLINSIFAAPLVEKTRTNDITVTKNEIVESDICLETSVVTYHEACLDPLLDYIESVNREYFENEQSLYKPFKDNRIHVCLFIIPSDSMTEAEIQNMFKLSEKCNLIPIISKADMYTPDELTERKNEILSMLEANEIKYYIPHQAENDEDLNTEILDLVENMPFAIIASETMYDHEGDIIRGRKYPWGFVNIEAEDYNDFKRLQRLLIYTNLDELIIRTDHQFYNEYRKRVFEMENNCEIIRETRYTKLRSEMLKILSERYKVKIEDLKREEEELDRFYLERIKEVSNIHEIETKVSEDLSI